MKPCMRQDLLGQIFVLGHSVDLCMCKNRIAPVRLCGGEVCAVKKRDLTHGVAWSNSYQLRTTKLPDPVSNTTSKGCGGVPSATRPKYLKLGSEIVRCKAKNLLGVCQNWEQISRKFAFAKRTNVAKNQKPTLQQKVCRLVKNDRSC